MFDLADISTLHVHVIYPYANIKDLQITDGIDDYYKENINDTILCTEWSPNLIEIMNIHIKNLGIKSISWHKITIDNYKDVISNIPIDGTIVFNLCDGNENTGWIGKSALKLLDELGYAFTGASYNVYKIDEIKTIMKKHLMSVNASTPKYIKFNNKYHNDTLLLNISKLKMPVLIKPANLSGSIGLTNKNVCHNIQDAFNVAIDVSNNYGPVYIEEFISGREFTCLCFGSPDYGIKTYTPLERVFNKNLNEHEKFLSYNTKWIEWKNTWWYEPASANVIENIKNTAIDTFKKANLNGYCRYDMREDKVTGNIYIVDVNLNCSMDIADDSSLQIILKHQGVSMSELLKELFKYALYR
jgi:D-alanine-D-alanine ligase-like ATP-grasp enzyme